MSDNPAFGEWDEAEVDGVGWNDDGSPRVRPTWTPKNTYG